MTKRTTTTDGDARRRIARNLAERQHALLTRAQLIDAGYSIGAIDQQVRDGRLVSVVAGVYAMAGTPVTTELRLRAAALKFPSGVVSHESAAAWHRLLGFVDLPARAHLTRDTLTDVRRPWVRIHRRDELPATTSVRGLRVTTVEATIADLAPVVRSEGRLLAIAADACRRNGVDALDIAAAIRPCRPGMPRLRRVLESLGVERPARSAQEARFQEIVRRVPRAQHAELNPIVRLRTGEVTEFDVFLRTELTRRAAPRCCSLSP